MSHIEYDNWKAYDKTILEGLVATKTELERQLLDINKDINKLIGKKVAESVFIREFNEHSLCQKCKLVTPLILSSLYSSFFFPFIKLNIKINLSLIIDV